MCQCLTWNNTEGLSLGSWVTKSSGVITFLNVGLIRISSDLFNTPIYKTKKVKTFNNIKYSTLSSSNSNNFGNTKLPSSKRIGPHNIDIISLIIGSVLGYSHLEKRSQGVGTRVIFEQSSSNVEYLMWFYKILALRGYCSEIAPKLSKKISTNNKINYTYRVNSYTFTSFNWLHEMFYIKVNNRFVKIIPKNIFAWLTPLSLAIWFMDDGSKLKNSARIATNCFTIEEVTFLCEGLKKKYGIVATPCKGGVGKGFIIYIHVESMKLFSSIVKPHMIPSMYYKLGNY
uniref:LAGLIDADG endonuclease n=1 Tax=Agaricus bitorquis TaxID=5343 RepID=UPI00279EF273|nr:LAGLIDADG endonuclease [Agaricus bitorquis]WFG54037.1 LAGLIDADG endonuclease [Agaricus bitorquis]